MRVSGRADAQVGGVDGQAERWLERWDAAAAEAGRCVDGVAVHREGDGCDAHDRHPKAGTLHARRDDPDVQDPWPAQPVLCVLPVGALPCRREAWRHSGASSVSYLPVAAAFVTATA